MLPAYALGNWWSRYHAYTQQEYLSLMDRFAAEDIPFSVGVVDMDWHIVQIPKELQDPEEPGGWTGYTWNEELFPDYRAFLKELHERNLKTALNLHPADGVRKHEAMYAQMARANGIDPQTGKRVRLDVLSKDHMAAYFDIIHHPYEEDGLKVLKTIAKLFRNYKPLAFFGVIAAALMLIAVVFFIPVLAEFVTTGLVPKFPTLIACGFVAIAAIQSFFTGLLLESIRHKNKQDFEMDLIHIQNNFNRLKNQ